MTYSLMFNHTGDNNGPTVLSVFENSSDGYKSAVTELQVYYNRFAQTARDIFSTGDGYHLEYFGYSVSLYIQDDDCGPCFYVVDAGLKNHVAMRLNNFGADLPRGEFNRLIVGPFSAGSIADYVAHKYNETK